MGLLLTRFSPAPTSNKPEMWHKLFTSNLLRTTPPSSGAKKCYMAKTNYYLFLHYLLKCLFKLKYESKSLQIIIPSDSSFHIVFHLLRLFHLDWLKELKLKNLKNSEKTKKTKDGSTSTTDPKKYTLQTLRSGNGKRITAVLKRYWASKNYYRKQKKDIVVVAKQIFNS